jgi:hypothetical protein
MIFISYDQNSCLNNVKVFNSTYTQKVLQKKYAEVQAHETGYKKGLQI